MFIYDIDKDFRKEGDHLVLDLTKRRLKSNKIKVFKMKRRKDYRRTQGHRQSFTEVLIEAISS